MRGDEHAPFAGWTPELMDAACAQYGAEQAELMQHMNYAYAEGRKDEAEERAWRPIESAPKDGTEVLLYAPPSEHEGKPVAERVTYGYWLKPSDIPRIKYQDGFAPEEEWDDFESHWMSWDGGFTEEHPPTHWMPLPKAPAL